MSYYSNKSVTQYGLTYSLNRAGVTLFWSFRDDAYIVESRYIPRYRASGTAEDEALMLFGEKIQESVEWQSVAQEILGQIPLGPIIWDWINRMAN